MQLNHADYLKGLLKDVDANGYLRHRESNSLEFKESFNIANKSSYAKTLAAFANNRGGYIVFGIKNHPRKPIGIKKDKFESIKQEDITDFLLNHFAPDIKWEMGIVNIKGLSFGFLFVSEAEEKPIICKNNADGITSGEIYFRYRGQDRKIEYPELQKIIQEYRIKEREAWMKHIEKIAHIGPQKVALLDLMSGDIETSKIEGTKMIMDKKLLEELKEKVNFIEEGHFNETEGEPTIKIIGDILTSSDILVPDLDPNKDYPFIQKTLAEKLKIKPYYVQVLIWKYKLKGNKKYHLEIQTSQHGSVHKFSKQTLSYLKEKLPTKAKKLDRYLMKISEEYQKSRKKQR